MGVTVTQPSVIKVQVGGKPTTVQSISFGAKRLQDSTDLSLTGAQNGDVIIYDQANNNFYLDGVSAAITVVDGGTF